MTNQERMAMLAKMTHERKVLLGQIEQALFALTDEERELVFGLFCRHCGSKDPRCQCWNDE